MIDFSDVRTEKDETYIFTTNVCAEYIEWAFEDAGITDYKIETLKKIRKHLPRHALVPKFIPSIYGDPKSIECRQPIVLVSHMNTDDLNKKLIKIFNADDPDLRNRIEKERQEALENYEQCYAPYLNTQNNETM